MYATQNKYMIMLVLNIPFNKALNIIAVLRVLTAPNSKMTATLYIVLFNV